MKLLLYDDFKLGVLQGEQVLDATAATVGLGHHSPQEMMQMIISGWAQVQPLIEQAIAGQSGVPMGSVRIRPPCHCNRLLLLCAQNHQARRNTRRQVALHLQPWLEQRIRRLGHSCPPSHSLHF